MRLSHYLKRRGCTPTLLRFNNDTSEHLNESLDGENITLDIVPPHLH